ncbi:MAG: aminodeoxychorismate/anthranilate synthase component II [Bacteroidetes bacterium]|nr:aminodeoxychorismate/anthranilate synthase component II [Bacteroidota bacterium]
MILLIDNYDSFTYNLYQYVAELGYEVKVIRNDEIPVEEIGKLNPTHIILSPGPGTPKEAGMTLDVIKMYKGKIPLLGVCLGHQSIGEAFGGDVVHAPVLMHGKTSMIFHNGEGVFLNLPSPYRATRYHSLIVKEETFPAELEITARTEDGLIMGLKHKTLNIHGVQFHPESILTEHGKPLLRNFLEIK